ncbi:acylphosphatase [Vulcaniibacterium tengchongense]|uniref:acylphosphatase n=1 Tax=Vulcaniibacterium tengchongense TaxID=1273429 RepID=A0A3N4V019_9GAMM|nr:acylphosphatase [Vulcaniibacterium tengchongense]RPE75533.1 acylphosphatase [Vulcaniibacterium tengchongense]
MSAARFVASGKVQGVWFRASARERARALGLRGYARNLPDGRVEVLAAGSDDALEQLAAWLREGPPLARVDGLERLPAREDEAGEGFATL